MRKLLVPVLFLAAIGFAIYIFYPREVSIDASGIKYRLGSESASYEESVHVYMKGKLFKDIKGNRTFDGVIELEGEATTVPKDRRQVRINFYKENSGTFLYRYVDSRGKPEMYPVGWLFIDPTLSRIAIMVYEPNDDQGGHWGGSDGLMIAAPAANRIEALNLSNEVMRKYLGDFNLE